MSVQKRQYVCNVLSPQPFCLFGPIFDLLYFIFTVSHWTLLVKAKIFRHWCFIKKALEKNKGLLVVGTERRFEVIATNKTGTADTYFLYICWTCLRHTLKPVATLYWNGESLLILDSLFSQTKSVRDHQAPKTIKSSICDLYGGELGACRWTGDKSFFRKWNLYAQVSATDSKVKMSFIPFIFWFLSNLFGSFVNRTRVWVGCKSDIRKITVWSCIHGQLWFCSFLMKNFYSGPLFFLFISFPGCVGWTILNNFMVFFSAANHLLQEQLHILFLFLNTINFRKYIKKSWLND